MPRIKRTESRKYEILRAERAKHGEKNDCSVVALAAVTGVPYSKAREALRAVGRKDGRGTQSHHQIDALRTLGFEIERIHQYDIIKTYPGVHRKLKGVTTHHPRRFRDAWFPYSDRKMLLFSTGHVSALVNGEIVDWAINNSKRVYMIWDVKKIS